MPRGIRYNFRLHRFEEFEFDVDLNEEARIDSLYEQFQKGRRGDRSREWKQVNPDPYFTPPKRKDPYQPEDVGIVDDPGYLAIRNHYRQAIVHKVTENPSVDGWYCVRCKMVTQMLSQSHDCAEHAFLIEVIDTKFEMV